MGIGIDRMIEAMKRFTGVAVSINPSNYRRNTRGAMLLGIFSVLGTGLAMASGPEPASATQTQVPGKQPPPLVFEQAIQPADRVLFVGDEITQQMFYTRAVACALLAMKPEAGLRFFNGGRDSATAQNATGWIDELMGLCEPTVVLVCLGLNDGDQRQVGKPASATFRQGLTALVKQIQAYPTVRQVVILSPPPVQAGLTPQPNVSSYNWMLENLAAEAQKVAAEQGVGWINLFQAMKPVYLASTQVGGDLLTHDGRLPTEAGHTVIASIVLAGLGVDPQQLDPVGWCPIPPVQMRRIRPALALTLQPPSLKAAQHSRSLYISIQRFDEAFFRLWRLTGNRRGANREETYRAMMEKAWGQVQASADHYQSPRSGP